MPRGSHKLSLSYTYGAMILSSSSVHGFTTPPKERIYRGNADAYDVPPFAILPEHGNTKHSFGIRSIPLHMLSESDISGFSMEEVPLNQIFKKAVVLQRSGDRSGALREYQQFLKVADSNDVDPSLYSEIHANMGAIYAMQGKGTDISDELKAELRIKAKDAFKEAVNYRPSLGSAWVNLSLLILAEGKELGNSLNEQSKVKNALNEARQCCERALGMDNDDERSRALANKLVGDIDSMMKQLK